MNRLNEFIELSPAELSQLVSHYGLSSPQEVTPLRQGIINTNYRFRCGDRRYLLRLLPVDRSEEALAFELSTLRRLAEHGFPCPRPLPVVGTQRPFSEEHGRFYVVFEYVEGQTLRREDIDRSIVEQVGRLFGQMQEILDGFVPEGSKPSANLDYVEGLKTETCRRLAALPGAGPATAAELEQIWARSRAAFSGREIAQGFVHADLYFDNVVVEGGEIRGIIDFDDSYYGSLVIDLAVVLMEFGFVEQDALDFELGEILLRHFYATRPSARAEAQLVPDAMVCACYKYLGYTSDLDEYAGEKLLDNEYIARIRYLADDEIRGRVQAMLAAALEPR